MDGADPLTFRILGKTCFVTLPPTIDGVPNVGEFEQGAEETEEVDWRRVELSDPTYLLASSPPCNLQDQRR
jgi:hypothetical protein